jgi:hypothetical protein
MQRTLLWPNHYSCQPSGCLTYPVLQKYTHTRKLLETSVFITISANPCYPINFDWFHGNEAKKKIISKWQTQKTEIFKTTNSQKIFIKFSRIGPWVSRIDWCKGHWCGLTYRMRAIISRGLYFFYPLFYWGLYFRVAYIAERLIFRDSIMEQCLLRTFPSTGMYLVKLIIKVLRFHFKLYVSKQNFCEIFLKIGGVTNHVIEWMGLNFDDYPGLQQNSKCA